MGFNKAKYHVVGTFGLIFQMVRNLGFTKDMFQERFRRLTLLLMLRVRFCVCSVVFVWWKYIGYRK